jgi:hypothetical protein
VQARRDGRAIAKMRLDIDIRRQRLKRRDRQRQAGDHARLPCDQDGMGLRCFGYRGNRGDVTGAAEVFVERAPHGVRDDERRQKRFRMQERG